MNEGETLSQFYTEVLGLHPEWKAVKVWKNDAKKEVHIKVVSALDYFQCPLCGKHVKKYDTRVRKLRHLDTCDYETILEVEVPRVRCEEDGVQQLDVGFAEKHSLYTELFENKVIEMLQTMTTLTVAKQMKLGWDAIDNIKQRAVRRGQARQEKVIVKDIGLDETSYQKGHDYVSTVIDKSNGKVIGVMDGNDAERVEAWFKGQKGADFREINSISMDMSGSFLKASRDIFPNDWERIDCYDRFHVSQLINKALDQVRRRESAALSKDKGKENPLKKARLSFLKNSGKTDNRDGKRRKFLEITRLNLETSRAWRIKEAAAKLWDYEYMGAAERNWKILFKWISRCRIPEMIKLGHSLKEHFWGILNAIRLKVTNALLESTNSKIQRIKKMACGYRNKERFKVDILFHFGGLDMTI
jgi:transposase